MNLTVFIPISALILLGAAEADAKCKFTYSDDIRLNTVDAEMIGKGLRVSTYDDQDPTISVKGDRVQLAFLPKELHDGRAWLDPPYFVIQVEGCGKGTVRSGFVAWDVFAGVRKQLPGEDRQPGYRH
jgi:hypothetical protein